MSQGVDRRWHYRRSLASRVVLLTTMAVGISVAAVAAAAFVVVRMQMQSSLDASMLNRAHQAAEGGAMAEITTMMPSWMLGAADVRIATITADKQVRSMDRLGPKLELGTPELAVAAGERDHSVRTVIADDGVPYRVVTVQAGDAEALVLAQSLASQNSVLRGLGIACLLFGLAGMIAAGLAGWAVARNGLRPVRRLTASAEEIARTEDLRPLPVEGADEIARLSVAFNQMLAALAASRDRQRRLVGDASHELRTPLTSLRTNLDLLTMADVDDAMPLPPEARAELLDDVRAQIEEMTTLIGDLVELARDEPPSSMTIEPVDLADVTERALSRVRRRAPGVAFEVTLDPWWVIGESATLERAVTNLLDNAAKWSPPSGSVRVQLAQGSLVVDDQGPGISPDDLPHVFERFYRSSESRGMPGSGLGLAIVSQVAARHSGAVWAGTSPAGGARLVLTLPGTPIAPPDVLEQTPLDEVAPAG